MVTERRAVFLDRDGVILRSTVIDGKPYAPRRAEDYRLLPGVRTAIRGLQEAGLMIVVVTNQPDIANGLVDASVVDEMHARLRRELPIDHIEVCPHNAAEQCACRKPMPGMLKTAAAMHGIDLSRSFMVGDRVSDVRAGAAVGCSTIFIDRGYRETLKQTIGADVVARSLPHAARHVLVRL